MDFIPPYILVLYIRTGGGSKDELIKTREMERERESKDGSCGKSTQRGRGVGVDGRVVG